MELFINLVTINYKIYYISLCCACYVLFVHPQSIFDDFKITVHCLPSISLLIPYFFPYIYMYVWVTLDKMPSIRLVISCSFLSSLTLFSVLHPPPPISLMTMIFSEAGSRQTSGHGGHRTIDLSQDSGPYQVSGQGGNVG